MSKGEKTTKKDKKWTIFAIIALLLIFSTTVILSFTPSNNATFATFQVSSEDDDARTFIAENSEEGYGDEDGGWALLQLSPSYSFGVRFTDVNISNNAKITEAYMGLYSVGTPGHRSPNCRIYCDDTDNAVNFSVRGVLDICGRTYSSKYIRWNTTVPYDQWVKTPSLAGSIQEIVNRKNWSPGNAIAFLFVTEELRGYSASFGNYEMGYPAKLYVKWEKTST